MLHSEKVKMIQEFKEKFNEKFGHLPIVTVPNKEESAYIMSLEELESYFEPFLPKKFGKIISMKHRGRYRELVDLRFIFAYFARQMGYQLTTIADYTNKHHSSIIHHLEVFKNMLETSDSFRHLYKKIFNHIKEKHKPNDELSAMAYFDKVWNESQSSLLPGLFNEQNQTK